MCLSCLEKYLSYNYILKLGITTALKGRETRPFSGHPNIRKTFRAPYANRYTFYIMRWSKLKQKIESNFAPSLNNRVKIYITRYRRTHDAEGRAWITVDENEIINMCTLTWERKYEYLRTEIEEINQGTQPEEGNNIYYHIPEDSAHIILQQKNIYSVDEFLSTAINYLNLSIKEALFSENTLVRALAILDKRVGKRTLKKLYNYDSGNNLLKYLYELRCEAEKINLKP